MTLLLEPPIAGEVMIDREQAVAFQQQCVVETRDRMLAPPLVIDAPTILNADDSARPRPVSFSNCEWLSGRVCIDPDRHGHI
ncbi:MAG TPA: hypothetical protein VK821_19920 [Dehalococcoidia bacterium]|nr:hypothetical protein [Dehalococcoidia bacterium]